VTVGIAAHVIYRATLFRKRLNEQLTEPGKGEIERLTHALTFLFASATITSEEAAMLGPEKAQEKKEASAKYFKRRMTGKSLQLLLDRGPLALKELEKGNAAPARELLEQMLEESDKKIGVYCVLFLAGFLALLAFLAASFASFGILPIVLTAVSTCIYIGLTGYNYAHAKDGEISPNGVPVLACEAQLPH
jgi:hypothetical protein